MKLVNLPRCGGKTMTLMQWLVNGSPQSSGIGWTRAVVVPTYAQAQQFRRDLARWHGQAAAASLGRHVYSVGQWQTGYGRGAYETVEVGVDELEAVLGALLCAPIGPVTCTAPITRLSDEQTKALYNGMFMGTDQPVPGWPTND